MKGKTRENQLVSLQDRIMGVQLQQVDDRLVGGQVADSESKETFYRNKKLREEAKQKAKMRAMHRRDKEFFEDFENADESMIRGRLFSKHGDDTGNIMRYGTDAQAGRSFGQKTRGKQSEMITGKAKGGAVKNYKQGGAVMAGRGGSFKGVK